MVLKFRISEFPCLEISKFLYFQTWYIFIFVFFLYLKISRQENRVDFNAYSRWKVVRRALNVLTTTPWYCYPRRAFIDIAAILDDHGQA